MKGKASVYDLRHMSEKQFNWMWSTSFYLLQEYIADGYDDDDLQYAYETEDVLLELYSTIQVLS